MHRVLQVDALAAWSTVIAADGCHRHVESMALELCNQCRCLFSFYASDSVSFNDMNDPMLGHKKNDCKFTYKPRFQDPYLSIKNKIKTLGILS